MWVVVKGKVALPLGALAVPECTAIGRVMLPVLNVSEASLSIDGKV